MLGASGSDFFINAPYNIQGCVFDNCQLQTSGSVGAGSNHYFGCLFDACNGLSGGNFEQNTDLVITNCWITNGSGNGIEKNHPFNGRFNANRIDNCAGNAISITTGGGIQKVRDTVGSGNGQYGCRLFHGANLQYQHTIGVNTVVGALGEIKIGNKDPILWADCPASDYDVQFPRLCRVDNGPSSEDPKLVYNFVYRPGGGHTGPVVFSTWQDLEDAKENARSLAGDHFNCIVRIDDEVTTPAVIPAQGVGDPAYNFFGCIVEGGSEGFNSRLDFADGSRIVGLRRVGSNMGIRSLTTGTLEDLGPLPGGAAFLEVGFDSFVNQTAGGRFFDMTNCTAGDFFFMRFGLFGGINFNFGANSGNDAVVYVEAGMFAQLSHGEGGFAPVDGYEGALGSTVFLSAASLANVSVNVPAGFLGTLIPPDSADVRPSYGPNPWLAAPHTSQPAGQTKFGQWVRYDASGGPIAHVLDQIIGGNTYKATGVPHIIAEESGSVGLTIEPPAGMTLNGGTIPIAVPAGGALWLTNDGVSAWRVLSSHDPNALALASNSLVYRPGAASNGPIVFGTWQGLQDRLALLRNASQTAGVFDVRCDDSVTSPCTIPMQANTAPAAPTAALTGPAVGTMGLLADKMTLTDAAAAFDASYVGKYIFNASWTTPANDGWKLIVSVISPTVIEYLDATGVAEAVGAGTYEVSQPWDMENTQLSATGAATIEIAANTTFRKLRRFSDFGFLTCLTPSGGPSMITDFGPEPFESMSVVDNFALNGIGGGAPALVNCYTGGSSYFLIINLVNRANISQNPGGGSVVFRAGLAGQFLSIRVLGASSVWRSGVQAVLGATIGAQLEPGCVWGSMNSTQSTSEGTESIFVMNVGPEQNVDPPADQPAHTAPFNMFAHQFGIVRFDASGGGFSQSLPQLPQDNGSTGKGSRITIKEESGSPGLVIVPHVSTPFEAPPIPDTIEGGVKSTGLLGPNAVPSPGEIVTIGGRVYTWVAAAPVLPDDLSIAATTGGLELDILVAAINGTGTPGVDYGVGTAVNTDVSALSAGAAGMVVEALLAGVGGDAITTTTTMVPAWGAATLLGGDNGSYAIPPNGTVVFTNDGLSNWLVESVYDPADAPPPLVIYEPNGTGNGPVVYSSWQACMDQIAFLRPIYGASLIRLQFDPTTFAQRVMNVPVGAWDMTDVEWYCEAHAIPRILEGTTFTKLRRFRGNMRVENRATATSPCTDLEDDEHIILDDGAAINQYGTVPMYDMLSLLPGDFIAILCDTISGVGTYNPSPAGGPLINMPTAGQQINANAWHSGTFAAGQFGGVVGTVINALIAGSVSRWDPIQPAFLGTLSQFAFSRSSFVLSSVGVATATMTEGNIDRFDTTAGNIVADLPAASAVFKGRICAAKNYAGGNSVNVTPDGADTIDGVAALYAIAPGDSAQFVSDGVSDWTRI
jgi:hypothetical protein